VTRSTLAGDLTRVGRLNTCPSGTSPPGCSRHHWFTTYGTNGIFISGTNDRARRFVLLLVHLRHHPGIGRDRDVGQVVRGHERLGHRENGLGLGLVPSNADTISGKPS
jgi:hypothetical protein